MEERFYPRISEDYLPPLVIILNSMKEYPDYLGKACPYSDEIKSELRELAKAEDNAPVDGYLGHNVPKWSAVDLERMALYEDLQDLRGKFSQDDTTEYLQTVKAMATLLDKLTEIGDRSKWMRQLGEFRKVVLEIMENVLTADERTEVMAKLRTAAAALTEEKVK